MVDLLLDLLCYSAAYSISVHVACCIVVLRVQGLDECELALPICVVQNSDVIYVESLLALEDCDQGG